MTRIEEAARRLIDALNSMCAVPDGRAGMTGDQWRDLKGQMDEAAQDLRIALTVHGEAIFVQIPPGLRPFQCMVLAFEWWRSQGCAFDPARGLTASWKMLSSAASCALDVISDRPVGMT